jgi:hypothetical protein
VSHEELRRRLQGAAAPRELDAERRSWAVVRAAYEDAEIVVRRTWPRRTLLALAAALAVVAAALSPPGQAVAAWVRDRVGEDEEARPALVSLPAAGRLLVASGTGAWVVHPDGAKRRLGAYEDASWSPHGLHVVLTRGPRLVATTPNGDVRWTLSRRARLADPRWAPSGYRIAYREGRVLRVVGGDSSGDRVLAGGVAGVPAAWRPGDEHVLAYRGPRVVNVVDADSRERLWRAAAGRPPGTLAWSADGERLYVGARGSDERVYDGSGRLVRRLARSPLAVSSPAFAPRGHRLAWIETDRETRRSAVVVVNVDTGERRTLLQLGGRFADLAWSPDGAWLVVTLPRADQWLFLRTRGAQELRSVSGVSREFDPGGTGPAGTPRLAGWCCAD